MKIVLYVIWALFAAGVAVALVQAIRKTRRHENLIAGWPKAQATVTGSVAGWSNGGGGGTRSRRFYPTYQFTHPDGTLFAGESEVSSASEPVPGSLLEVAYNPVNPNQSFQVAAESKMVLGCMVPLFAVFVLVAFWFVGIFPVG